MAISYGKTGDFKIADSLFHLAIKDYKEMENIDKSSEGVILRSWSKLYRDYNNNKTAVILLEKAMKVFEENSENNNYFVEYGLTQEEFVLNYMALNNLEEASNHLEQAFEKFDAEHFKKGELIYHKMLIYKAMIKYNQESYAESLDILEENKQFIKSGDWDQEVLNEIHCLYLAYNCVILSDYEKAEKYAKEGIKFSSSYTKTKAQYFLLFAEINSFKAEYQKVLEYFQKALNIFQNNENERIRVAEIYALIADVEITLSHFSKADKYLEKSMKIYPLSGFKYTHRNASLNNTIAYVNYSLGNYTVSDSIYNGVLKGEKDSKRKSSISSAVTYNGLGLVKFNAKKYSESEELFNRSIKIYEEHFNEESYFLGIVYLNYASLLIETNQLDKAQIYLSKTEKIFQRYLDVSHDNFGDLYLAFGDFYKKKKESFISKDYYQKALKTYSDKFDENHHKVILIKRKL